MTPDPDPEGRDPNPPWRDDDYSDGSLPETPDLRADMDFGPYRLECFLGQGAFSEVFLAIAPEREHPIVLKVGKLWEEGPPRLIDVTSRRTFEGISPDELSAQLLGPGQDGKPSPAVASQEILQKIFEAEAAKLEEAQRRPIFPEFHGLEEVDGRPVLVMQHCPGATLREKIRTLSPLHLSWLRHIVAELERLSKEGHLAAHGDLKPENIIIDSNGKIRLIDPGITLPEERLRLTTPHYNPLLYTDHRADIAAIGIMIYEILAGTFPFDDAEVPWPEAFALEGEGGLDKDQQLELSLFLSYWPPKTLNPKTPPALEQIVYRCICGGYPEYGDLRQALEESINNS
ncbi:hypothetical protein MRY87_05780 [bacterium]|nr:hypothetical protein [bacterium]